MVQVETTIHSGSRPMLQTTAWTKRPTQRKTFAQAAVAHALAQNFRNS